MLAAVDLTARGYRGTVAPLLAGPVAATLVFLSAWFGFTWAERRCTSYALGSAQLLIGRGIVRRRVESVDLSRIREARLHQTVLQRLRGVGRIALVLDGPSRTVLVVGPLAQAEKLHRMLRDAAARELTRSAEPVRDRR